MSGKYLKKQRCSGFTLIETVLYLALMTIMISVLGGIGINILESNAKAHAYEELAYNAHAAFGSIQASLWSAQSVASPVSSATTSTLTLTMEAGAVSPVTFSVSSGTLMRSVGSEEPKAITTGDVVVRSFTVSDISYPEAPPLIRVGMEIGARNPEQRLVYDATETFYTSITLPQL